MPCFVLVVIESLIGLFLQVSVLRGRVSIPGVVVPVNLNAIRRGVSMLSSAILHVLFRQLETLRLQVPLVELLLLVPLVMAMCAKQ